MSLHGNKGSKALPAGQFIGLAQLPGEAVGDADIACFTRLDGIVQPLHDFVKRRSVVPHMIDVQVHMVHAQVLQAFVQHAPHMLLSADSRVDLLMGAHGKFGGHHHVLPAGKVPESAAQILLAGAVLIHDGRIKEVDAQFQGPADDGP